LSGAVENNVHIAEGFIQFVASLEATLMDFDPVGVEPLKIAGGAYDATNLPAARQ
jgi:hypothetical protein